MDNFHLKVGGTEAVEILLTFEVCNSADFESENLAVFSSFNVVGKKFGWPWSSSPQKFLH